MRSRLRNFCSGPLRCVGDDAFCVSACRRATSAGKTPSCCRRRGSSLSEEQGRLPSCADTDTSQIGCAKKTTPKLGHSNLHTRLASVRKTEQRCATRQTRKTARIGQSGETVRRRESVTVLADGERWISSTRAQETFQWYRKPHRVYAPPVQWKYLHRIRTRSETRNKAENQRITTRHR